MYAIHELDIKFTEKTVLVIVYAIILYVINSYRFARGYFLITNNTFFTTKYIFSFDKILNNDFFCSNRSS